MKRYISFLFITLILITSCEKIYTENKKVPRKTVIFLFDLSASTKEFRNISFETFKKILSTITYGDTIVAAKITEASIVEPDIPIKEHIKEFVPTSDNDIIIKKQKMDADNKLASKKEEILKIANDLLSSGNSKKTDIMSSLHLAERIFKSYKSDKSILIILSDMIEDSKDYNFERENLTAKRIEDIIKNEKSKRGLPDLSGVKVYIITAGRLSSDRYFSIQNFWLRFFKECGANLTKENYGPNSFIEGLTEL